MNDYNNLMSVLKSWWVLSAMRDVTEIKIKSFLFFAHEKGLGHMFHK